MIPKIKINAKELQALRDRGVKVLYPTLSRGAARLAEGAAAMEPLRHAKQAPRAAWRSQHKYNAKRVEIDGVKFHSTSEGARYHYLKAEQTAGRLIFFLMQTRIDIPGSTYRLDFLEFWADGRIVWLDVKGFETEAFKIKRRAVEAIYPFKITTARQRGRGDAKTWEYA
jgi:hypothetical protein